MSRIWWATIFGLLLGALLLAMMQRGCDAGANIDPDRMPDPDVFFNPDTPAPGESAPQNLAPISIEATTPNLGRRRPVVTPEELEPQTVRAPDAPTRGKTRRELQDEAAERKAERERRLDEIRTRREVRNARSRELTRQLGEQSRYLQPGDAERLRHRDLTPTARSAQRKFREQLVRRGGVDRAGNGSGAGDAQGVGGEGEGGGEGLSDEVADALDDLGLDIPSDALQALEDLGGVPSSDPVSPLGDERTDTLYSGGGALVEELIPVARWEPVSRGLAADGREVSSADLFLGFATRPTVPVLTSAEENGLRAPGGGFFTGLVRSTDTISESNPTFITSTRLDTFVTVGGAAAFFTPGSVDDPSQWGEQITAEWATSQVFDVEVIEPDPERFGDERYYLWVGRFAAPAGTEEVSGTLGVTWLDLASFSSLQADVEVGNCASCWLDAPPEPEPEPENPENPENPGTGLDPDAPSDVDLGLVIDTASIVPVRLTSGQVATATVRLRGPAPEGGATVAIGTSDGLALLVPEQLVIPAGESEGTFSVTAGEVFETVSVSVFFDIAGRSISRAVTVATPGVEIERFTVQPQQVLGGLTVRGTVRLAEAAGENGATLDLTSSSASVSVPTRVVVSAGETQVRFDIATYDVTTDETVTLTASSGASQRATELVLKAELFGDVNRDGVLDSFDLAALLVEMGGSNADADLNDDGVVDYDDLEILVDLLEASSGSGQQPGGDLPVIARWLPVPITNCDGELDGYRSADLYLGYRELPEVIGITSDPILGLRVEGGEFYQHPLGTNRPPTGDIGEFVPCALYDSYVTIGETRPFFTPTFGAPAWGSSVGAEWFASPGTTPESIVDPGRFGDDRTYVRIGRFTVPAGATFVGGQLELVGVRDLVSMTYDVSVYHCSSCWGQFDLNGDGVISDADVEIMIDLLGQEHPAADLDGDGLVDIDDIRLLITAIGS